MTTAKRMEIQTPFFCRFILTALLIAPLAVHAADSAIPTQSCDVAVFGATPSGIAAAIAAKRGETRGRRAGHAR